MITRITGTLESVDSLAATVTPGGPAGGVSFQVLVPTYLAPKLATRIGQVLSLTTLQYFDSPNQGATFTPRLIGFEAPRDRDFFELFTTVKGIGNRKALRAMAVEPAAIAAAIVARNAKALTDLPEIGKRLAETIIAELSGKVEAFLPQAELEHLDRASRNGRAPSVNPVGEEAIEALVALGEQRPEAERRVERALARAQREGRKVESADDLVAIVYAGS